MKTYAFRITCTLSESFSATKDCEIPLALPAPARPIKVFLRQGKNRTENSSLALWCGGFGSEAEARAAGAPVKTAVMLAGLFLGAGIDVGDDQVVSPALQGNRSDGQPDERFQPDVHGLQVVPEIEEMMFGFLRPGRPVFQDTWLDRFEESVVESYALGKTLTKKQTLAAQLYNHSHFLSSDAARFITLISAVEALAEPACSSPAALALVECLLKMTAEAIDLEVSEQQALKSRLGNLKQESIGSACRALMRTHCGEPAAKDFARLYETRSKLLHTGVSMLSGVGTPSLPPGMLV